MQGNATSARACTVDHGHVARLRLCNLIQHHVLMCSPFLPAQGHSLGGSLATLLVLMYLRRGVLPPVAVSPVYTFGAPAVFCEGDCACGVDGPGPGRCSSIASVRRSCCAWVPICDVSSLMTAMPGSFSGRTRDISDLKHASLSGLRHILASLSHSDCVGVACGVVS